MAALRATTDRWAALDNLRGLTVLLMIPVNAGMELAAIPPWLKHAPAAGLTLADLVVPAFLFALGVSSSFAVKRRLAERGVWRTIGHAARRYGLLFALGSIGWLAVWRGAPNWEVLQMLGIAGAIAFPFLFLAPSFRAATALLLLAGVEALRPALFEPSFRAWHESGIGGPLGAVPLAAIPIAASALGEALLRCSGLRRAAVAAVASLVSVAAGIGLSRLFPIDKHLLSTSYLVTTFGVAAAALGGLTALERFRAGDLPPLGALGRNPLVAYMLGGVVTLAVRAWVPTDASALVAWAATLGTLAVVTAVALILDAKRIALRL